MIQREQDDVLVIRDLPHTSYAQTDQNVKRYNLQTYIGRHVKCGGKPIGSLCVVFQKDVVPSEDDKKLLEIAASAVGVEEERRQAQEELLRISTAVEGSSDAIGMSDPQGRHCYQNRAFANLFEYTAKELDAAGGGAAVYSDKSTAQEIFKKITSGGSWIGETQMVSKGGRTFPVFLRADAIKDDAGNIIGLIGVHTDITVQKRSEREKRKLEASLQRAEKMEVVGTLAGGVAHDLNNILGGLVSYPDLLLMELPEDSPLRKPVTTIKDSGQKAAAIVDDLLTLARRGVAVSEVANLNDIITEYLTSPEHERLKSFHASVEIESRLETDLLNTLASPVHLSKTIMNLVSNASEALPDGGKVTISTKSQYIDKPVRGYDEVREGDYVVLTVADNGVGISSQDAQRIFEPFYTKKVMGRSGTGLGMAVVWGTVKDHKGYIELKSIQGKGTIFDLYFPVTRKQLEKEKAATSIQEYMGHGQTILVVDDVQEQREIASVLLTQLGYAAHAVSSGEEAVEYVKTNSTDLLVLDMIMDPGIDGLDTYKKIREVCPEQRAIIASGFSETRRVKQAQRLGAGQYIKKPYTLEKIGLAVKTELEK